MKPDRFHRDDEEPEDDYERYLWDDPTRKSFAHGRKPPRRTAQHLKVVLDPSIDPADVVGR